MIRRIIEAVFLGLVSYVVLVLTTHPPQWGASALFILIVVTVVYGRPDLD